MELPAQSNLRELWNSGRPVLTMFWNPSTWPLSAVWSCWFYWEGPLVKHGDRLYNNTATVTFNRCPDCVCHLQLWGSLLFCLQWRYFLLRETWQIPRLTCVKVFWGSLCCLLWFAARLRSDSSPAQRWSVEYNIYHTNWVIRYDAINLYSSHNRRNLHHYSSK